MNYFYYIFQLDYAFYFYLCEDINDNNVIDYKLYNMAEELNNFTNKYTYSN